jgi:predicted transcriptional regulator/transcriptional regulator with XRE-family HTH domain
MAQRKIFAGVKLRALREQHKLTQAEFAARLDISTSYINQLENNQRPVTAAIMLALAETFNVDVTSLLADKSDRMIIDLKEIFADPLFADNPPGLQEMKSLATNTPQTAHAFMRLYEAYRKSNERMAGVDDVLMREQAGNLQTSYEEVRDFFHYADNYIDPLDRAAEDLAMELALHGHDKLERLVDYCQRAHDLTVEFVMPNKRDMIRQFDRTRRVIRLNTTLEKSTQFFQLANQLALLEQTSLINQILTDANFKRDEARAICRIGLANYYAGALLMPYQQFLKEAQAVRYDIEIMAQRFGASLEQVAHRLSTLQRPQLRGIPFFFARVDQAGTITKRHSATALQFARFGGACPLWNVHRAFESPQRIIRQRAETPDGKRYLCLAWASEKRAGGFRQPTRRYAYALGCEIDHASQLVYSDDLDISADAAFDPIGVSCRTCERRNCTQRSVPPIAAEISITPDDRNVVPYEIN